MNKEIKEILECLEKYGKLTPDAIDDLHYIRDYITNLQEENKELKERIGNAIEYIESNDLYTQDIDYDYDDNMVLSPPTDELERKELLNILRGEDNVKD